MNSIPFRVLRGPSSPDEAASAHASRGPVWKAGVRLALCLGALTPLLPAHAQGTFVPTTVTLEAATISIKAPQKLGTPNLATGTTVPTAGGYEAGQVLVKFKGGPNGVQAEQIRRQLGVTAVETYEKIGWQLVKLPAGMTTSQGLGAMAKIGGIASAEPNYRRAWSRIPNDPFYNPVGFAGQYHLPKIHAPDAWDTSVGSSSVVIAIMDSGVQIDHPDLEANIYVNPNEIAGNGIDDDDNGLVDDVHGWDFADDDNDPNDADDVGHGTHVAGLAGAVGNNRIGVTGVNWDVKLLPLRIGGEFGVDSSAELRAFEYVTLMKERGVNIVAANCSFGGAQRSVAEQDAIIAAGQSGVLTVAAAGNGDSRGVGINNDVSPTYPASYETPYVFTVAATDENDNPTTFTNYGASSVDIAAPGQNILSTYIDDSYTYLDGTSMAAPIVAGAVGLLISQHPEYGSDILSAKYRLMDTAEKLPQLQGRVASNGRLNLATALGGNFSISGTVSLSDGNGGTIPLAGVTVTITETGQTTVTDDAGNYIFTELPAGTYTLQIAQGGFQTQTQTVTISGGNVTANFVLVANPATYSITGRVVDDAGAPLSDVQIFINGGPNASATTDSSGNYIIPNLGAGTFAISASKNGYTISANPAGAENITLPTTGINGSPGAVVNFVAVNNGPDLDPPTVFIDTPVDGDTISFTSGNGVSITATGSATDETGVANLYFTLARQNGRKLQYYNWTKRSWTSKATAAGVILTRNVSGMTEIDFAQALPKLSKGTYILTASGRDTLGNVSDGSADAVSTFTVEKVKAGKSGRNNTSVSAPKS